MYTYPSPTHLHLVPWMLQLDRTAVSSHPKIAVRRSKCKTVEGQFASIKEPRSPTTKKNKTKRRTIYCGGGDPSWRPKPFPPTPVATIGLGPASFQK